MNSSVVSFMYHKNQNSEGVLHVRWGRWSYILIQERKIIVIIKN